ncbi:MAG: SDR family oxidoreductase [Mesorhizobium sp.]|uniref:SDR family NAD(P)-dependent oxidoreductase n=1 Tax=unclassified Mesorhizobium TaxID=325217 RepID=UPI000FD4DA5D|nr:MULTISPECIES: SDR family NAD(P)-dependent oxidoreductase [unclassified Mesorhizobium]RVD39502.1 SDR family oxidoreductase [Mesorhizobium sp. M4A.F.Ca.ET.020.02.1.1]RWC18384.1 MAG: SDR family oxidoreductase [Mesorhizobium sp.]RWC27359.1 MAG: SDR family oxidoreductase [Mesorhizobium sp.]RWC55882.1 MAG: SDR family oxidoreductase [Mesorhizobium sp.]RWD42254.1 MAG: SDR family oxidoreductase [Mesorhizobium sp.]
MTDNSLLDQTVILTGAAGGIGSAIAQVLSRLGARLILADYDGASVERVAASLDPEGERVAAIRYDASNPADAETVVATCLTRFGHIDHVVPAAAIFEDQPFATMTDEQWRRMISVNLDGVFFICRRAIPHIRPGGSIVTIASSAAHEGSSAEHVHYGASKGGVLAFVKSLAKEVSPHVRVNNVSPGTIDTPMVAEMLRKKGDIWLAATPAGRFGTGEDVGNAVAFLCSNAASYIMGQTIHVNGGLYMGG